jgi:competence protein ComEA
MFLIWILPQVIKSSSSQIPLGDTSWITEINSLKHMENDSPSVRAVHDESLNDLVSDSLGKEPRGDAVQKMFYFDPNTISVDGWKKLGIRQKTINVIHNYLAKGGHFEKPGDLKKIYGIHAEDFARLQPYIQIQMNNATSFPDKRNTEFNKRSSQAGNTTYDLVEINTADTAAFIALPGIGSKLAARIINFRDKLGGFYSILQVGETYGLADSTFQKIKPWLKLENVSLKKINVNAATKDEMKSHPYLKWTLANAIVEYRNQHGKFSSAEELKKVGAITEEVLVRIKPYISVE